jgi:hypothetical protein
MQNNFSHRFGTFFILVGLVLLILFLGSVFSGKLRLSYFLLSAAAFFLGNLLQRRAPRLPSGRFDTINKLRGRNRQDPEDKE